MAYNSQTTESTGLSVGQVTHYQDTMLDYIKPKLLHSQFATPKALPKNRGKVTQFRRWTPLATVTTPLVEVTIPDGQTVTEVDITATVYQYGAYITTGDLLTKTHLDITDTATEMSELCGDQGGRSVDEIVRDVMATTTNVQYVGSDTAIYTIAATEKMTTTEIRKAVRTLDNNNAMRFRSGGSSAYVGIIDPDVKFDLQADTVWIAVAQYSDKEKIYTGEIGTLYSVKFVETTQAKQYVNANLIAGAKVLTAASLAGLVVTVDEAISAAEALALVGRYVNVMDIGDSTTYHRALITAATAGVAGAATVTVDDATTGFTIADGDVLYAGEYGQNSNTVHATMIFGDKSYSMVEIGSSKNVKILMKDKTVIGGPLEQFSTVGWKVEALAVVILQDLWLVKVLTGATDS